MTPVAIRRWRPPGPWTRVALLTASAILLAGMLAAPAAAPEYAEVYVGCTHATGTPA